MFGFTLPEAVVFVELQDLYCGFGFPVHKVQTYRYMYHCWQMVGGKIAHKSYDPVVAVWVLFQSL